MASTDVRIQLTERYRVVSHLANGGMASLWIAEDQVLGRRVAVKVLAERIAAGPASATRFEREARTAASVGNHPNVATIYDVGEHDGASFIVMELFNGGTVADRLRANTVSRSEALTWLEQAAAALDHAHAAGIVHRDVKPANLLLDDHGRVAVGDFGIARMAEDSSLTQTGQVLGSAAYLSPEQVLGQPATDASDRYALAIVAFELLTGRRPFQAEHTVAQALQHVEAVSPPSGLGREVDAVLHRGMAKDPEQRFVTARRFAEELTYAVQRAGEPSAEATPTRTVTRSPAPRAVGGPPTPTTRADARTSGGKRRSVLALAALGAVTVVAAAIALFAGGGSERASGGDPSARTQTQQQSRSAGQQTSRSVTTPTPESNKTGESPEALNDRGFALLRSDPAAAIPVLEASVRGFARQGEAADRIVYGYVLYNLGQAYLRSGRVTDAIAMFERRLEVSPSDRPGVIRQAIAEAKAQLGLGKKAKKRKGA